MRKRQVWIEPKFAESKLWHHGRRFRWRGIQKVNMEALLRAAGQNLKQWLHSRRVSLKPWLLPGIFLDFPHLGEQIRRPDPC
jgi:hypothetical protein